MPAHKTKRKPIKPVRGIQRRKVAGRPQSSPGQAIVLRVPTPPDKPWQINQEEVTILKNAICKGATDEELKFCLAVARRHKLDPFRGQIWFVKRKDSTAEGGHRWIPIVGIGGMRHIAARDHKDYGSIDEPEFGPMHEISWSYYDKKGKFQAPEWAKVTLWKKGLDHPTVATVFWNEIYPEVGTCPLVRQMPRLMLGKCAEAQGLRRAYPATDGLYIKEEFQGREEFTPSGREIVYNEPAQLEEAKVDPNWKRFLDRLTPEERERELAIANKHTPEQRAVLEAKMRKSSVTEAGMDPSGTLQPSKLAEAGSTPASSSKAPQVKQPAGKQGAAPEGAAVPCLFYRWFAESQTARVEPQPNLKLSADLKALVAKKWNGAEGAAIFNGEELEALRYEFEKRGVPVRRINGNS